MIHKNGAIIGALGLLSLASSTIGRRRLYADANSRRWPCSGFASRAAGLASRCTAASASCCQCTANYWQSVIIATG